MFANFLFIFVGFHFSDSEVFTSFFCVVFFVVANIYIVQKMLHEITESLSVIFSQGVPPIISSDPR